MQRLLFRLVARGLVSGCILFAFWAATSSAAELQRVVIPLSNSTDLNHEDYYFSRLLELALRKTEAKYNPVILEETANSLADKRLRLALTQGRVDVLWSPTSVEFEQHMLPVRISLLKELNNYRLFLIRKGEQWRFSAVKSLDDLRKLKGGMGAHWTDAGIMRENNLPQVQAVGYGKLFKMLAAGRFDYFSRGLYQIQSEVNLFPHLELQIEQELILHYPNEVYFFVSKENQALATRIEEGLTAALADGSFDELFNSIPRYRWGVALLENNQRRVFTLHALPPEVISAQKIGTAQILY